MTNMMRVWQLPAFGLRNLEMAERPIPTPGPHEVLIRVAAVSLNYRDRLTVEGQLLPEPPVMPFVPLSDMAGVVVAVGPEVTRVAVGERVMGQFWTQWIDGAPPQAMRRHGLSLGGPLPGMLAEYVVIPDSVAVRSPASLSDHEAATLPIAALTAWFALVETGRLKARQTVLVQGTGGVSLFGLQLATALGARVIVISRDAAKLARTRELGAFHGININDTPEWSATALDATGGRGVDHILELIGGGNLRQSIEAVADGGRIAQIGFLQESKIALASVPLMLRQAIIQGISVGHRRAFEDMSATIDRCGLKPVIDHVYAFDQVPAAFAHLARGPFGKVVVSVQD